MNQWYHLSVKSRRGGKEEQKTVGAQREKQNKNKEGKVWGEGVAGQGWDQGRVVGMVQSSTPSILIFKFFLNHSLHHTTRHSFLQTGKCRATRSCKQITEPLLAVAVDLRRGCLPRLSTCYSSPTEGGRKESRQNNQFTQIWRKKQTILTPVCYALY